MLSAELRQASGADTILPSSATHRGTDDALRALMVHIEAIRAAEEPEQDDPRYDDASLAAVPAEQVLPGEGSGNG